MVIPILIWGSTWFVITFQLGIVPPLVSVVYRFGLGGLILLIYCLLKKEPLKFSLKDHVGIFMQGIFLFGLNYWAAYTSELYIPSGLVAVIFATIIFFNSFLGRILLARPILNKVILGAVLGVLGTVFIFWESIFVDEVNTLWIKGGLYTLVAVLFSSLGNISSAYNQTRSLPVLPVNAIGMVYGAVSMAIMVEVTGERWVFDFSWTYISSLVYLAVFGSIIAFGAYLTLVGQIGADKAAYVLVVIPIVSLSFSVLFENYQISSMTVIGIALILFGNIFALFK